MSSNIDLKLKEEKNKRIVLTEKNSKVRLLRIIILIIHRW